MTASEPREPRRPAGKTPVLVGIIFLIGLLITVVVHEVLGREPANDPSRLHATGTVTPESDNHRPPPADLQKAIDRLAGQDQNKIGIVVRSVEEGWVAGHRGGSIFPQGGLRRLWLGVALLDAVEHGELALTQRVPPAAAEIERRPASPDQGPEIREILRLAVGQNDREAQDQLLDSLGGPAAIAQLLGEKGLAEVAYGPSNRAFDQLLQGQSSQGLKDYLSAPPDAVTPDGVAFGLAELLSGKLLSPVSSEMLLNLFSREPVRDEDSAMQGSQILRLSGETHGTDGKAIAANAIAAVGSRAGRRFAIAVFAAGGDDVIGRRDAILKAVIEAVQQSERL